MFCWCAAIFFFFVLHSLMLVFSAILRWGKDTSPESSSLLKIINTLTSSIAQISYFFYAMLILVAIYIVSMQ
jgi:hypothetical protein